MNKAETAKMLSVLKAAYPQFYNGLSPKEASRIVDLWEEMFEDDPVSIVAIAVKSMIATRTNTFPPNIGEIKEQIAKLQEPREMTAAEAWAMVADAVRNGIYGAQEEFDRLPEQIRRIVGSPRQIREWAEMDADTVSSVIASNFQRSYAVRIKSDREFMALPSSIKQMVSGLADQIALKIPDQKMIGEKQR